MARRLALAFLAAAGLALAACTESDETVFDDVGVTRLVLVDPALARASIADVFGARLQVAEWTVTRAVLHAGDAEIDLLVGEPCSMLDTAARSPAGTGACGAGIVLEPLGDEPVPATLELRLTMRVRRVAPPVLADGDGIPSDGDSSGSAFDAPCEPGQTSSCDDNCPLVDNRGQEDANDDGFGDACTTEDALGALLDSDADDVGDVVDNCPALANPSQGVTDEIREVVGEPCEDVADVHSDGALSIELDLGPIDFLQPADEVTFVVVDFNNARALDCQWPQGVCALDMTAVRFCLADSPTAASLGCPF